MNLRKNYNKTPIIRIGRTDTTMSAEEIRNTLRDIATLIDKNEMIQSGLYLLSTDGIKTLIHWRETDGMHFVHVRKDDDSVTLFKFANHNTEESSHERFN